MAVGTIDHAVR